jgi:uncharacterized protein
MRASAPCITLRASEPAKLISAVWAYGVQRYLVVGGAGSLEIALGKIPLGLLLSNEQGNSISFEDYAVALVD